MNLFKEKRAKALNSYYKSKGNNSIETSVTDKVVMALGTMKDVLVDVVQCGEIKASESLISDRTEICTVCDEFLRDKKKCKVCGWYMELKIPLKAAKCPIDKW